MKVLFVTGWAGSWPYIPEMVDALKSRGISSDVFDIDDVDGFTIPDRLAFRVPALRPRVIVGVLRRKLAKLPTDYDAVNIHFVAPVYRQLIPALKRRGRKLVTSIWGSDFLRASPDDFQALERTLDQSDLVTTNNPEIAHRLTARFPQIESKIRTVPFGLGSLDVIADLLRTESVQDARRKLGLPQDKVIVAVGYNAVRQQQHGMIIDGLACLPSGVKDRIYALVPMTYPDDPRYQVQLREQLQRAQVDFKIVSGKRGLEDICRLRIVSDLAINMQTTDSLSGSLQEHMFSGTAMIVGSWLPYRIFEEMGVPVHRVDDAAGVAAALERLGPERRPGKQPAYAQRIYDYSSWAAVTDRWINLYQS